MTTLLELTDFKFEIAFSIVEQTDERVLATMPIATGMTNPMGTVHAGAMIWFADVAATRLARLSTGLDGDLSTFPLGININAAVLSNQRAGVLTADARFLRRGTRIKLVRTLVTGAEGKLLLELTSTHLPATSGREV